MSRYIDADAYEFPDDLINEPTADVVEVVRCKDCKHRETYECPMYFEEDIEWDDDGYTECETVVHDSTSENAYCSYGERRDT